MRAYIYIYIKFYFSFNNALKYVSIHHFFFKDIFITKAIRKLVPLNNTFLYKNGIEFRFSYRSLQTALELYDLLEFVFSRRIFLRYTFRVLLNDVLLKPKHQLESCRCRKRNFFFPFLTSI